VRTLVEGLDRRRYQPLVAGQLTPQMRERLSRQNIAWVNLAIPQAFSLQAYLSAAGQLRRLVPARDVALVHCHNMEATAVAGIAMRGWQVDSRVPLVCSLHAPHEDLSAIYRGWRRRLGVRWLLSRCDAIVVPSHHDREQAARLLPHLHSRLHVVYPGLERSPSRPLEAGIKRRQAGLHRDAAIVGLLSHLEQRRGIESFLEAAAVINEELPNVEFAIIGEGPDRRQLEEIAHKLGLTGSCIFLGSRRDVREVIAALNIIVLLSDANRAALRGLQALAAGLRVIAAPTPALREILGPMPGVELVEIADTTHLAKAIRYQLHITPQLTDSDLTLEERRSITYSDFLVSQTAYDLEEPWTTGTLTAADDNPIAQMLGERFGPERLVAQIESIYNHLGV